MVWSIACELLGKEKEEPSAKAMKEMSDGWQVFFEAVGLEFVGEGLKIQLRNPLWLLLVPIVATLAAIVGEFGLSELMPKKGGKQQ